jgi:class 3 adenylate cyclase
MVFFNDPVPCEQPALDAVKLALEIQQALQDLRERWHRLGHPIGVGTGIASGYATLGLVGNQGRADYTAIGNVVNIASRLCDQAKEGEILIDQRAYLEVEDQIEAELRGPCPLKGVGHPVVTYSVAGVHDPRPNERS